MHIASRDIAVFREHLYETPFVFEMAVAAVSMYWQVSLIFLSARTPQTLLIFHIWISQSRGHFLQRDSFHVRVLEITFSCSCADVGLRDKIRSGSCVGCPHVAAFLGPVGRWHHRLPWDEGVERFQISELHSLSWCRLYGPQRCRPLPAFLVVVLLLV